MSHSTIVQPAPGRATDRAVLTAAVLAVAVVGLAVARLSGSATEVGLLLVAVALGWVFLATRFGYTSAIRGWLGTGNGGNLAAGLVVAAVAALVIVPVAALVDGYAGFTAPLGLPLVGGAALFGLGMQLADGCGSGTLYKAGGGSRRLWITLPCFCAGGLLGSLMLPAALRLPALPAIVLADQFGAWGGLAATLALSGLLILALLRTGRPSPGKLPAAVLIGALAAAAFLLSGQPWGVTMGLTLWGAKAAASLGLGVAHTEFWSWDGPRQALEGSILLQDSSLMDIGMLLGAMAAAAWDGSVRQQHWPDARGTAAAVLGGVLMGVGARLSFGCNIGALVGGIASGSLHGFVWLAAAIPGSWLGMRLRPWFGMARV
jgi:uncharacterized membrane protein YedE/YeeE